MPYIQKGDPVSILNLRSISLLNIAYYKVLTTLPIDGPY